MQLKEITNRWLTRSAKAKGVLACGVRYPDRTSSNHAFAADFNPAVLENSWECVAGVFEFLKQHQNDVDQMCWVFDNYRLYCAVRADQACLGVFTAKSDQDHDQAGIQRILSEFKTLKTAEKATVAK